MPIQLIAGLGNPGAASTQTRHNAGFWFVDAVARERRAHFQREAKFQGEACRFSSAAGEHWLFKPATYMNKSGSALQACASFYKIPVENILVAHDDLDLPPGVVRLKQGGGHGGHNGLRDIIAQLGPNFLRLRIGIGHPGKEGDVSDYVLQRAPKDEQELLDGALSAAHAALPLILGGAVEKAMQQLHTGKP
ncbi:MAG: aminoacyl-tRNA hydrolase [Gammaproteobacteria bacterium]|nr:aminoacyl-tRNA hydrolase [Gammaproteobacteria bacterium]